MSTSTHLRKDLDLLIRPCSDTLSYTLDVKANMSNLHLRPHTSADTTTSLLEHTHHIKSSLYR